MSLVDGWAAAVSAFAGIVLLLSLVAGEMRERRRSCAHAHYLDRCARARALIAAVRAAPSLPAAVAGARSRDRAGADAPPVAASLAERADATAPSVLHEISVRAKEDPDAFGRAIRHMLRREPAPPGDPPPA